MYNSLLKKVQSNYFSYLFDNCLYSKSLWHPIDKILHQSNPSQQISPSIHSANQFSSFFGDKIKTLLYTINCHQHDHRLNQLLLMKLSDLYYILQNQLASLIPRLLSYLTVLAIAFPLLHAFKYVSQYWFFSKCI